MRKSQKKRLDKAKKQAKKNGGMVNWRNGRPIVIGQKRKPRLNINYLPIGDPIKITDAFDPPDIEEQTNDG